MKCFDKLIFKGKCWQRDDGQLSIRKNPLFGSVELQKVSDSFEKIVSKCKRLKFDLSYLGKRPLEWLNLISLLIVDKCYPQEAPCQKKNYHTVLEK